MSIQCEMMQKRSASSLPVIISRLEQARTLVMQWYASWIYQRRVTRSRRVLEALPEHILHDIGWPNVDDRLPGIPRKLS